MSQSMGTLSSSSCDTHTGPTTTSACDPRVVPGSWRLRRVLSRAMADDSSEPDPHSIAREAAGPYTHPPHELGECWDCAKAIRDALKQAGCSGEILELTGSVHMLSKRTGLDKSVKENGRHFGVLVDELVFDNIDPTGLSEGDWVDDFDSRIGVTIAKRIPF